MSVVPVGDLDLVLAHDDMPGGGCKSIATVSAADEVRATENSTPIKVCASGVSWGKSRDSFIPTKKTDSSIRSE